MLKCKDFRNLNICLWNLVKINKFMGECVSNITSWWNFTRFIGHLIIETNILENIKIRVGDGN